jgi:hypothetical protein
MAPHGPSKSYKQFVMREMLVGAVGIEPTTFGLKGRCSTTELRPFFGTYDRAKSDVPPLGRRFGPNKLPGTD